eukprot:TRINITY_DN114_c0_g3_i2.p1 TRINITY_DN114_c0_g3~~TRINITY_DN114_c0_g3_i2.p1  ORF type:complete len:111 (-),score=32.33 TRINITY_DN114_c0_g3_i2:103-435(-)
MDMIAYSTKTSSYDVLLETKSAYSSYLSYFEDAAALVPGLKVFISYSPFGSDHISYLNKNIPAILTIDNDYGSYAPYHRTTDDVTKVVPAMASRILQMNAGALAAMVYGQ